VGERCTPGSVSSARLDAPVRGREEPSQALLQTRRELALGALGLDQRLQMDAELQLVGARAASGQVAFDLQADDIVDLMIEEALDLPERFLTLGPAVIHRQVPVPS